MKKTIILLIVLMGVGLRSGICVKSIKRISINPIDEYLKQRIIMAESSGYVYARSKYAYGLMGINPTGALRWFNLEYNVRFTKRSLYNPSVNICIGVSYVTYLYKKYGCLVKAINYFNMGEGRARRKKQWNPHYMNKIIPIDWKWYKKVNKLKLKWVRGNVYQEI